MKTWLFNRLKAIEDRIKACFFCLPGNDDGFITALGVDPQKYQVENSDGSTGYDFERALSDTAAEDWK